MCGKPDETVGECVIIAVHIPGKPSKLAGCAKQADWKVPHLKVSVKHIGFDHEEQAIIQCYELNDNVKSIVSFIKSTDATLAGYTDERVSQISLQDILFVEAVDNKTFAYTSTKVYGLKCKLYEFAEQYEDKSFFRCSKSFVINLMKIDNVRPILNGRFCATMYNGEEVIISRQYVPELKKRILGEQI